MYIYRSVLVRFCIHVIIDKKCKNTFCRLHNLVTNRFIVCQLFLSLNVLLPVFIFKMYTYTYIQCIYIHTHNTYAYNTYTCEGSSWTIKNEIFTVFAHLFAYIIVNVIYYIYICMPYIYIYVCSEITAHVIIVT